jgi:hypothetical protein
VGNKGKYAGGNIIHSYNKMEEVESLYLIVWQQQAVIASVSFSNSVSSRRDKTRYISITPSVYEKAICSHGNYDMS